MANVANWLLETCSTIGSGDLILTGAGASFSRFRDAIGSGQIWYSIEDGANREAGIGTFNGADTITRDEVHATYINGIYDNVTPAPIPLSGNSLVACTFNSKAFNDLMSTLNTAAGLAATALQPGNNVSELVNDVGYITSAVAAPVDSVAGKIGDVILFKADITDFSDADYATAAQGLLAASALQSGDNVSSLVNDAGYSTSSGYWTQSGTYIYYTTGNVLIGSSTDSVNEALQVTGKAIIVDTSGSIRSAFVSRKDMLKSTVSGNTAYPAGAHALAVINSNGTVDNNVVTIGLGVDTTLSQSNAVIAGHSIASGEMDLAFYCELANSISEKMRIKAGGNVLIGTSSDNTLDKLQINGTTGLYNYLHFRGSAPRIYGNSTLSGLLLYANTQTTDGALIDLRGGTAASNPNRIRFFSGNGGVETAAFTDFGNLLLGTTTDNGTDKLQIFGDIAFAKAGNLAAIIKGYRTTAYSAIVSGQTIGDSAAIILFGATHATTPNAISFRNLSNQNMTLMNSGNLLIGTTVDNAADRLQVSGGLGFAAANPDISGRDNDGRLAIFADTASSTGGSIFLYGSTQASAPHQVRILSGNQIAAMFSILGNTVLGSTTDNGADRLQVNGNIGFSSGVVSPAIKGNQSAGGLSIFGNSTSSDGAAIQAYGSSDVSFPNAIRMRNGGTTRLQMMSSGNFVIGSSSPVDDGVNKLQVSGSAIVSTGFQSGGPILGSNGTALLPSFSFGNDPDTGMYRFGANVIGFSTNGTLAMTIGATGDIGSVGNIYSAVGSAVTPSFSFNGDTNTGMFRAAADTIGFSAAAAEIVRMDGSNMTVYTDALINGKLKIADGTALLPSLTFGTDLNTGMYLGAPDTLGFSIGGSGRLIIDANFMSVYVPMSVSLGTAAIPGIGFDGDSNTGIYSPSADNLAITTGGSQRSNFNSSGQQVTGAITATTTITATGNIAGAVSTASTSFRGPVGSISAPTFSLAGDTNTGMYSPSADNFAVTTGGAQRANFNSSGQQITGAITATGNITAYSSDARLKKILGPLEDNLNNIMSWKVVEYEWNQLGNHYGFFGQEIGFIAQDIQATHPGAVAPAPFDIDEEGNSRSGRNYITLRQDKMLAVAVGAIQELKAENDFLKSRIVSIEKALYDLGIVL